MPAPFHDFADRLGRFFETNGLPRMAGRVLGHLLTSDPPEQTFDEIVDALAASRSTVSVASRLLVDLNLIERFSVPRQRRDRYRVRADAWTMLLRQDMEAAVELKRFAEEGLLLLASKPPSVRARLRGMQEFYAFLEQAYIPVVERWSKRVRPLRGKKR